MPLVRGWLGTAFEITTGTDGLLDLSFNVFAGWTLLRTIASFRLEEIVNFPHFPPAPRSPNNVGIYQATNITDSGLMPTVSNLAADWVAYEQVDIRADFGAISSIQSDLCYSGTVYIDSKAQRKLLVDTPLTRVAFISWGADVGTPFRQPEYACSGFLRQLWEHEV